MTHPMTRTHVLDELLGRIRTARPRGRALVAVDGVDGAGKTHLSGELVGLAERTPGRPVLRVGIDGFHHPRATRRAAGTGPEGFYRGSYRYDEFRRCVVDPVRSGGAVTPAVWDVDADEPATPAPFDIPADAVVLVDGIFLHRPELADVWDASIWVDVPFAVSVPRGNARWPGDHDPDPEAAVHHRYVGGQRLYLAEVDPRSLATWVLDNTDLDRPTLVP